MGLRQLGVALMAAGVLLGTACTAERLAGWYVTRRIAGYLDLSSEQRQWLRQRVDGHIAALRRDVLPKAVRLLRRTRALAARGPTEAEVRELQASFDALADGAVARLAPDVAKLLAMLDDAQVARFRRKLRENLDEAYEDLRAPPPERRTRAREKLVEGVEEWTGDLRRRQIALLLRVTPDIARERTARYRDAVRRLRTFTAMLHRHPGAEAIERELLRLWRTRYDDTAGSLEERRRMQRRVLLALDETLTLKQRRHVIQQIDDRIRQLKRFLD
ncbi:MAG: DUF6279 family lipoprotein [Myxococcota bacterium]